MKNPQAITLTNQTKLDHLISSHIVGSQAYGLQTPESDIDRIKTFAFDAHSLLSIKQPDATVIKKIDDGDLTYHEIGKWASLAAKGNPTMIELLYIPSEFHHPLWQQIVENKQLFLGKQSIRDAYYGYAYQQFTRIKNRGDGTFDSATRNRTAKHARHLYRLMLQCEQLISNQDIEIRLSDNDRDACFEFGEAAANGRLDHLESVYLSKRIHIDSLYDDCKLPTQANMNTINDMIVRIRRNYIFTAG